MDQSEKPEKTILKKKQNYKKLYSQDEKNTPKIDIRASGSMFSFIGCLIQGYFADKYGRKIILYVAYSIYFVGWMIISQTIYIIEARLLISFAAGMAFSNSVYIAEIIHPKHRGMFLSLNILFNELGSVTIFFFNYDFSLQTISFVASIFALALLIIIFFIPETPYWYLLKQQREKAIQSLIQLRGLPHNKVEIEISQIEKNFDNFNEVATVMMSYLRIHYKFLLKLIELI
ncbi:hypothetical protein PGB90_007056 [Kerria lacca]